MAKIVLILLICMFALSQAGIRDNVAATIPDEFELEISIDLDNTKTHQKLSVSDRYNAVKNLQTITMKKDGKEVTKIFTTVAMFSTQKIFMMSDDSKTCHERPIQSKVELVQMLRRVILDPNLSQLKSLDADHLVQFTKKSFFSLSLHL